MSFPEWATTAVEVLGGSLTFGGVIAGFRATRHRDTLSGYKELVELADRRHELDQEALREKDREIESLKQRVSGLEAGLAQLQTVAQIAEAVNKQSNALQAFTTELAKLSAAVSGVGVK